MFAKQATLNMSSLSRRRTVLVPHQGPFQETMEIWQKEWEVGETRRIIFNIIPNVKTRPIPWRREEIIFFFTGHGPFGAYLKRFNLASSPYCSCGGVGSSLHYDTECLLPESWHFKRTEPQLENLWFQRVAANQLSKNKIFNTIRFIHTNGKLFAPD
ncbi:hypothetical protein AVEN_79651-1 [Araneus ventricosus]|uniref:Uncharacterized protein n=1 Tax=Araneus ventricosus TaxID=182803 RepID=A0A4Y2K214_ARAVE|nr:hypothetical protein AVEN_79651-1 [Araneus ventricosus]